MHWRRKWQPTPVFLPGESQGQGSLVGCHLWGRTELDTTEATQQQQQQHLSPAPCLKPYSKRHHLVSVDALLHVGKQTHTGSKTVLVSSVEPVAQVDIPPGGTLAPGHWRLPKGQLHECICLRDSLKGWLPIRCS